MMFKRFLVSLIVIFVPNSAFADRVVVKPPIAEKWADYAEDYLTTEKKFWLVTKDGKTEKMSEEIEPRDFSRIKDKFNLRCVRMNNYGCFWQRSKDPEGRYKTNWAGTPGPNGSNGAHDGTGKTNGHAIFIHPKWSILASYQWFEKLTRGNKKPMSALQMAEIYAPWCDTLGSYETVVGWLNKKEWGRNCPDNGPKPKADFKGPLCEEPAEKRSTKETQCESCNCPNNIATYWLKGINELRERQNKSKIEIDDEILLFNENGYPSKNLRLLITWKTRLETGAFKPKKKLFNEANLEFAPKQF